MAGCDCHADERQAELSRRGARVMLCALVSLVAMDMGNAMVSAAYGPPTGMHLLGYLATKAAMLLVLCFGAVRFGQGALPRSDAAYRVLRPLGLLLLVLGLALLGGSLYAEPAALQFLLRQPMGRAMSGWPLVLASAGIGLLLLGLTLLCCTPLSHKPHATAATEDTQ